MGKINTAKVSGTQELLPMEQAAFNRLKSRIAEVYRIHGYREIETPVIERTEILLAKAGGETEKQIYKLVKTGDKSVELADQALRFDHTVPLARYVVEHENDLVFPFKVAQLGLNYRGERAQKGRFREFYQCDIDIVGRGELPIAYDADVISTLLMAFEAFQLDTPVLARINNRKIFAGLFEYLGVTNKAKSIYRIIDHAEKVTREKTIMDLEELELGDKTLRKIYAFMRVKGERSHVIKELGNLEIKNPVFNEGLMELDQTLYLLETLGLKEQIIADMGIVRGLDYYTGTVFEFILPEYKNIGSVCGGGRYNNLSKHFTDRAFPGVGGSIGLTRLFYVLNEAKLLDSELDDLLDYVLIPVSEHEFDEAFHALQKLHSKGHSATIILTNRKLGDKLSYATKVARNGIVIGEEEVRTKSLRAKNFQTGEVVPINLEVVSDPEDFWAD